MSATLSLDVSEMVERFIPPGERSAFAEKGLENEARRRMRLGVYTKTEADALAEEGYREMAEAGPWPEEPADLSA